MTTHKSNIQISKKLTKAGDSFTVNMYDNGFMIEVSGRDKRGEFTTARVICNTVEEVLQLSKEICTMERDT